MKAILCMTMALLLTGCILGPQDGTPPVTITVDGNLEEGDTMLVVWYLNDSTRWEEWPPTPLTLDSLPWIRTGFSDSAYVQVRDWQDFDGWCSIEHDGVVLYGEPKYSQQWLVAEWVR